MLEIAQLDDVAPSQVRAYADEVAKQSHGSLRLHFKDSWRKGELDFEKGTLEDVTRGEVPGAWVGVRSLDLIGVTSFRPLVAPMLVDSQAVQNRIFSEGIPLEMARGLEGHGLVAVAVLPGPMRKVLGVRKPFLDSSDFRDTTLGIQGGDVPEATATFLGATFNRMQSGASLAGVDAYEQQVESIFANFYAREAKYVTANLNLWPQAMAVVLNEASYRALTFAQREALGRAATHALPAALEATRTGDAPIVAKLCGEGVAFPTSSAQQLADLRRAVQPVHNLIARDPGNARMLDRLTVLRAEVAAPPDVSACPSQGLPAGGGSFPEGDYSMVLDNDAFSRCTDGTAEGTPGRKSYFSLAVRGHQVTIHERIDSQTAPEQLRYDGVSFAFRDQVQIDGLIASWSFDGTALRLTDMKGGSCGDAVIWTTNPWVPHSVTAQAPALALPDGRYETVLSAEDRHLCDDRPGQHHLNREIYDAPSHPRTWYLSFTLDGGTVMEYESEVSHSAIARMGWVGSYRVYGNTFELTDLRSTVNVPAGTERRAHLAAAFTFDGKTLTLKPVGSWPCDGRVLWTLHPWKLARKAP